MPTDPRLNSLVQAIVGDPTQAPLVALRQDITDLRRRVAALESTPTIQVVSGTPTQNARDGTAALDSSQPRLWLRRNGSWVYATLT